MKNNCTYKSLGEVCNIRSGSTPLRSNPLFWDNGTFPWFTIEDIRQDSKYINSTNQHITELAKESMFVYPPKTVLLCCTASVGACAITDIELTSNQQFNGLVIKDGENLIPEYLFYFCKTLKSHLLNVAGNAVINFVSKEKVSKIQIPIPSIELQKKAIAELDQINALIAIKEKQLRELEELEQTIFHEMFGDPIDNEKGWNVDLLSNLCEVFAGGDKPKNLSDMQSKEFPYPVIANGDGGKGILGYSNSCRVKEDAVTIGARGASIGNCRIVKNGFTPAIRLITLVPKEKLNCYFLYFFVRNMDYRINGVAQAQLTVPNIEKENILVPPIALQLHFAEKMREIEILKDNLSTVKRDLEELHASRMQYWFD